MKKVIILILCLVILFLVYKGSKEYFTIPKEAIRFRIVANSNSPYDQLIKEKLRVNIEPIIERILKNSNNIDDARISIKDNLDDLNEEINKFLKDNNYDTKFSLNYGNNYFPEKIYKGTLYKKGKYESLVITLGEGKGDNWWCLLFPPICYMDFDDTEEVEYKFLIQQIFDKLK